MFCIFFSAFACSTLRPPPQDYRTHRKHPFQPQQGRSIFSYLLFDKRQWLLPIQTPQERPWLHRYNCHRRRTGAYREVQTSVRGVEQLWRLVTSHPGPESQTQMEVRRAVGWRTPLKWPQLWQDSNPAVQDKDWAFLSELSLVLKRLVLPKLMFALSHGHGF